LPKSKQDRLLAALIAKLPPPAAPWVREERIAWLRMMAMAFDAVYGSCAAVSIALGNRQMSGCACSDVLAVTVDASDGATMAAIGRAGNDVGFARGRAGAASLLQRETSSAADLASPPAPLRFYVDHDGFAMGDGKPIAMEDLPEGATLWDRRSGLECGDLTTILWRDIGTTRRSLPRGVILRAATEAA